MKIHITHTDLDAAGCHVVFQLTHGVADYVYPVNHDRLSDRIMKAVQTIQASKDEKNVLWITDIAPSVEDLQILSKLREKCEIFVCDHHKTSSHLGNVSWINFVKWDTTKCGAQLALEHAEDGGFTKSDRLRYFIQAVNAYDLWLLDSPFRQLGEDLNHLFHFYGFSRFVAKATQNTTFHETAFTKEIVAVLRDKEQRIAKGVVNRATEDTIHVDREGHSYLTILGSGGGSVSNIGAAVLANFPIDYVLIVSAHGVVSLRSDGKVDVGAIAKRFGGGGHPGAAGFKLDTRKMFDFLFDSLL